MRLALPATSANLGPAFDAAALAMDFYLRLRVDRAPDFFITAEGRDAQICSRMENHLIVTTYCEVLESENRKIAPLRIHIQNEIPIGKGCGSSAAARLAGIALAVLVLVVLGRQVPEQVPAGAAADPAMAGAQPLAEVRR